MSRLIKFKFWNTKLKKMLIPVYSLERMLIRHTHFSMDDKLDNLIPLQFTGIYDKDGEEIYESDLVNISYHYKDGKNYFEVVWDKDNLCFAFMQGEIKYFANILNFYEIEKVGNAYETKAVAEEMLTESSVQKS